MAMQFVRKSNEEKRQEIEKITKELDEQVSKLFDSETYKRYLKTMSKFHNYSFNNTLLIAMQRPDASLVAGFNAWKQNFHRNVKRGEKGIKILAPAPVKVDREMEIIDPRTQKPVLDKDGRPKTETVKVTIPLYKVAYVYDLAQTEGDELPSLGVNELTGKVDGYKKLIKAVESVSPVPVSYEDIEGNAKGFYSLSDKKIVIQQGMSELQTLKTLIHEACHSLIHDDTGSKIEGVDDQKKNRNTKEVEAESTAFTVLSYLGMAESDENDVGDYSFGYIAGWSSGKELKELKESMETIRKTASYIITGIEDKLLEKTGIRDKLAEAKDKVKHNDSKSDKVKPSQIPVMA